MNNVRKHFRTFSQRGHATVEFTALAVMLALILFAPIPGSSPSQTAGQMLAGAVRDAYSSISFFLSLP